MSFWKKLLGKKETPQSAGVRNESTQASPWPDVQPLCIHEAAKAADIETIKALLSNGIDVNSTDEEGKTPLHVAVERGDRGVVELLLARGADVNAKDKREGPGYLTGSTALHIAVSQGAEQLTRLLLAHKADVDAKDNNGAVPLHYAAFEGHESVARLLVDCGADVNARASNGDTPSRAAERVRQEAVAEAIAAGRGRSASVPIRQTTRQDAVALLLRQHGGHE